MAQQEIESGADETRRESLGWIGRVGLAAGLTAAYGTLAAYMGRFLFPARPPETGWMFVTQAAEIPEGEALLYRTPSGRTVNITRQGGGDAFLALSSTCPHLGCQVHWQPQNNRFFCPCHNGVFTPQGEAIGGPPAESGQSLPQYSLKVDRGLLFIEVALDELALGPGEVLESPPEAPRGPGHDPCLYCTLPKSDSSERQEA
ncbi:MAG: Rieske (2Fe-2S) protein [Thermoanaerobaculia bacterium]|nr:Rieske (2Fe-2S) protein [Thermoanaerobaculia bacterium]